MKTYNQTEMPIAAHCLTAFSAIVAYAITEDWVKCAYSFEHSERGTVRSRFSHCRIHYAKPDWSDYQEPYIRTHGVRVYLDELMVIR